MDLMVTFEKYWKFFALFFAGLVGAGVIATVVTSQSLKKEVSAQDELYAIEVTYNKHVEKSFPKMNQDAQKKEDGPVDLERLKLDLKAFSDKHKGLIAGQVAGMYLADLLVRENKTTDAINLLTLLNNKNETLTSVLLGKKLGQLYAESNQCPEAIKVWDATLQIKKSEFIKDEIKMNHIYCLVEQKDMLAADKLLSSIKSEALKQDVDRVRRLIQFQQKTAQPSS